MFLHLLAKPCNKVFPLVLQAQAVALTVAQAFTIAFELWQVAKEGRHHTHHPPHLGNQTNREKKQHFQYVEELLYQWVRRFVFVLNQLWPCKDIDICCKQVLTCPCYDSELLICILEKGKRAKSGSAGEASSSSHSERSNSLGSLKGTGETHTHTKYSGATSMLILFSLFFCLIHWSANVSIQVTLNQGAAELLKFKTKSANLPKWTLKIHDLMESDFFGKLVVESHSQMEPQTQNIIKLIKWKRNVSTSLF